MKKLISVLTALAVVLSILFFVPQTVKAEALKLMYVNYNEASNELEVVQKYSDTEDFVMVMKPLLPNKIFNIAPPKTIKNTSSDISDDISAAALMVGMAESDWIGPYFDGSYWYGGTHDHDGNASGRSDNIVLKLDGTVVLGNADTYAESLQISWTNHIYKLGTKEEYFTENITAAFDGEIWSFCDKISFLNDTYLKNYYGL